LPWLNAPRRVRNTVEASALVMRADAEDAETLNRVKDVTGRHLERFGEKDGLVVTWQ
jgi:hypothetical protein